MGLKWPPRSNETAEDMLGSIRLTTVSTGTVAALRGMLVVKSMSPPPSRPGKVSVGAMLSGWPRYSGLRSSGS